jgi:hypothetical protein
MNFKIQIGLEHERVITSMTRICSVKGNALLPHDTMACLAETRGRYAESVAEACINFLDEQFRVSVKYAEAGLHLEHGEHTIPEDMAKECLENSPDKKKEKEKNFNLVRGGGLHVHFSLATCSDTYWTPRLKLFRNMSFINLLALPQLDAKCKGWITGKSHYRVPSQCRIKPYGFEYRSMLWTGDAEQLLRQAQAAYDAVETSLRIMEQLKNDMTSKLP